MHEDSWHTQGKRRDIFQPLAFSSAASGFVLVLSGEFALGAGRDVRFHRWEERRVKELDVQGIQRLHAPVVVAATSPVAPVHGDVAAIAEHERREEEPTHLVIFSLPGKYGRKPHNLVRLPAANA